MVKTFKELSKAEKKHLKEVAGCTSLKRFKATAAQQAEYRRAHPNHEPCWECSFIACKLGLEV